jgi:poly(3-hydroxybutyrate) depolymerase
MPHLKHRLVIARITCAVALAISLINISAATTDPTASQQAVESLKQEADPSTLTQQPFARTPLTSADAQTAEHLLWDAHVAEFQKSRAQEVKDRVLRDGKLEMPFFYKIFGDKPATGRSLFISMHGGGNAPKEVNDSQYENQKHLYKPAEGIYLAPRAPTDTWNLWHESHIDRFFDRLIQDLIVLENVDPNRIYIMGYSAGGDGVYQLAPRMADRLAAASMMAGHPNDASPLGLRNIGFAIHVGALDNGYNRNAVAQQWSDKLDALQKNDPDTPLAYIHIVKLHEGRSHWMNLEDAEALPWMAKFTRTPFPTRVVWKQSGTTHTRFYWLAVDAARAKAGDEVVATYDGQKITIENSDPDHLFLRLNDHMMDLDKPVTVLFDKKKLFEGTVPRTIGTLAKTLDEDGDPAAVYSGEIEIKVPRAEK